MLAESIDGVEHSAILNGAMAGTTGGHVEAAADIHREHEQKCTLNSSQSVIGSALTTLQSIAASIDHRQCDFQACSFNHSDISAL